ncbi:hypothetical protein BXY85_1700 [Roseivirga pacifica]|uniref:Lipoprotein n=1 Tax=Roseivirga pacifica TaxID=1267423 RepID=A0A1I0MT90_9BACT|nr:hypothetical protein [Roseivirga pacifica]MCO6359216.1 hypothetical protein [Roseivirga pacifica]MCO6365148.1 hypothetical protein [Roseivirga pacifica]MCO6372122.1 hypothetical protein [Roseivirga pacifica]MCO6375767.1 hypothetical protein [Roseivirga pacifica]MCO6379500.1 hypothetical protein [Roseivirga pacifica]
MKTIKTKRLSAQIIAVALTAGLVVGCDNKQEQIDKQSNTIDMMQQELAQKDSTYNSLIGLLNQAESQVAEIARRENLAVNASNESGKAGNSKLVNELAMIDSLVAESNQSIQKLKTQLRKSQVNVQAFEDRLDKLSTVLREQEGTITDLKAQIRQKDNQLQVFATRYDSIKIENVDQKRLITEQADEIDVLTEVKNDFNKVHYAVGPYKELKEKGLVDKEGGFLWIGRTIDLQASAQEESFVETDIREFDELKIEGKRNRVKLVTDHPEGSYEMVADEIEEDIVILKVKDPKKFWEMSNYLVVSTK